MIIVGVLAIQTASSDTLAETVVAICPSTPGPAVTAVIAERITHALMAAVRRLPETRVADRSAFAALCSERDIVLSSQWSARRTAMKDSLGADEFLLSTVLSDPPHIIISARRMRVATGELLSSSLGRVPGSTGLEDACDDIVEKLWTVADDDLVAGRIAAPHPEIEALWKTIDQAESRRLVGSECQRAESVYRQYRRARAHTGDRVSPDLERTVLTYLTDCVELVQRVQNPPLGMVFVPEGYVMIAYPGTRPRKFVVSGFFIDKCPFTRSQYSAYLERRQPARLGRSSSQGANENLPVVQITLSEAECIAEWRGMSLPTYAQWRRAVSGDGERTYPWGNAWRHDGCNSAADPSRPLLEPVGSFPEGRSPFGVLDGAGCVFEWLATAHDPDYWLHAPARNPAGPPAASQRVTVGGSFRSGRQACRCDHINPLPPHVRKDDVGFRCCLVLK